MGEMARAELEAVVGRHLDSGELAAAATAAIRGYGPEILGYLAAVLRDDDAAAEAFSRFAEDLWKGLPGFRRKSSMRTWAYRVAWNAASSHSLTKVIAIPSRPMRAVRPMRWI